MPKKNGEIDKFILDDVERKVKLAIADMAAEISYIIENNYEKVISMFYNDYEPSIYRRTYSTYLASNGYDNPFSFKNLYLTGDIWTSGIIIADGYIPGNPYRANKDWVLDRTFNKGIHGINIHTVRHRNATLKNKDRQRKLLAKYFNQLNKNQKKLKLKTKGIILHQQQFNNLSVFNSSIPKNMTPPPRKIMDDNFKKLTKRKNLDKMFNDTLQKYL